MHILIRFCCVQVDSGGTIISHRDVWDAVDNNAFLSPEAVAEVLRQVSHRLQRPCLRRPRVCLCTMCSNQPCQHRSHDAGLAVFTRLLLAHAFQLNSYWSHPLAWLCCHGAELHLSSAAVAVYALSLPCSCCSCRSRLAWRPPLTPCSRRPVTMSYGATSHTLWQRQQCQVAQVSVTLLLLHAHCSLRGTNRDCRPSITEPA